jgi:hypothetical protein
MQRAFDSLPTQLTVNQAAGVTANAAAAAAAVQPAEASHARSLVTSLPAVLRCQRCLELGSNTLRCLDLGELVMAASA